MLRRWSRVPEDPRRSPSAPARRRSRTWGSSLLLMATRRQRLDPRAAGRDDGAAQRRGGSDPAGGALALFALFVPTIMFAVPRERRWLRRTTPAVQRRGAASIQPERASACSELVARACDLCDDSTHAAAEAGRTSDGAIRRAHAESARGLPSAGPARLVGLLRRAGRGERGPTPSSVNVRKVVSPTSRSSRRRRRHARARAAARAPRRHRPRPPRRTRRAPAPRPQEKRHESRR